MKKLFFSIAALALAASSNAQQVTAQEPEFIGSYCILTSDSTYVVLPKENGKVEKHQNKFSKFSKIAGAVSDLGFAGGMVGLSTGSMAGRALKKVPNFKLHSLFLNFNSCPRRISSFKSEILFWTGI